MKKRNPTYDELKRNISIIAFTVIKEQKYTFIKLFFSLIVIALSHSLLLLSIGPFLKIFFDLNTSKKFISLTELIGKTSFSSIPFIKNLSFEVTLLIYITPLIILLSGLLKNLASSIYQLNVSKAGLYSAKVYRDILFKKIMSQSYASLSLKSPAEWMSILMNDVLYLQNKFVDILKNLIKDLVILLTAFVTMLIIHPKIALFLLLLIPLLTFCMGNSGKRISNFSEIFQKKLALIASIILDIRKRFEFIKAQQGEHYEQNVFDRYNQQYYNFIRKSILITTSFAPIVEALGFLLFSVIIYLSTTHLFSITNNSLHLVMFFATLGMIIKPLKNISEQLLKINETKGAITQSIKLLSKKNEIAPTKKSPSYLNKKKFKKTAHIHSVSCGFQDTPIVYLKNLAVTPGKAITIIGPNGCGKSTILRTIAGLLTPITWRANINWIELSQQTTMISQTPFLFNNSLLDNLIYGLPNHSSWNQTEIWQLLEKVHIATQIKNLPNKLQTNFQTLCLNFSGGQIQKLILARTLLRKKKIVLLDEATSAIDPTSEYNITFNLINEIKKQNKSLITVTHRTDIINLYDDVICLKN